MSVQALSWVLEHSESRLGARCVLIAIANHAHADGRGCWIKVATIARESRLSEREVQYAIVDLKKSGELEVQIGAGPKGTNVYSLPKMGANSAPSRGAQSTEKGCTEPLRGVHTGPPEPSKSEPLTTEPKDIYPPFEVFWEQYPRKLSREDAYKAWKRIGGDQHLGEILASLRAWKLLDQWNDKAFIPYPATWLNSGRWKESPRDGVQNDLVERKRELEAKFESTRH